jgi:hypothetical protein
MREMFRWAAALSVVACLVPTLPSVAAAADAQDAVPVAPSPGARRPEVCTEQYQPVCGRIAETSRVYSNACFARAAGAKIVSEGPCVEGRVGPTPK